MKRITSTKSFRKALTSLSLLQQRLVGACLIKNVLDLTKNKMIIEGKFLLMSDEAITDLVGAERIAELKKIDPTPLLKAFVVGHEGESKGRLIGFGNVIKTWVKSAIQYMHEKLIIGTKVFYLHNQEWFLKDRFPKDILIHYQIFWLRILC